MSDISIIEKLNKQLMRPLKQVKQVTWFTKGYVLNERNEVTHLSMFRFRLKGQIPQELFQLKHLQYLDIRENNITIIPNDISLLCDLEYIDIRINQLQTLPSSITKLNKLYRLYLGNNLYTTIPEEIAHLKNLNLLDISENNVKGGCEVILMAPKLKNIYLNKNCISHFPFNSIKDKQFDELILKDNPLREAPSDMSGKITNLLY